MRLLRSLSWLTLVFIIGACAPTKTGDKCLQDTDCGFGFICEHTENPDGTLSPEGTCQRVPCLEDSTCPTGFTCEGEDLTQPTPVEGLCQDSSQP